MEEKITHKSISLSKNIYIAAFLICVTFFLELFVFNYRFWESFTFNAPNITWKYMGLEKIRDDVYLVNDSDNVVIYYDVLNIPVKNLYLDIFRINEYSDSEVYPVVISATDAGNTQSFTLPETEILPAIPESMYVRTHLVGNSSYIGAKIGNLIDGELYYINAGINQQRELFLHLGRIVFIFLLLSIIWAFHPGSELYNLELNLRKKQHILCTFITVILIVLSFFIIGITCYTEKAASNITWSQYGFLAESFANGKPYFDFDVPPLLQELSNPYDAALRNAAFAEKGESYILDLAYYNGHYYCYFGIIPVLLFYLPFYIITGTRLDTFYPIMICSVVFVPVCFWFVFSVIKKYFPSCSLGMYLLLSTALVIGSGVLYGVQFSILYSLPGTLALVLNLAGLTCWINATDRAGKLNKSLLTGGAFAIALVMGCRPQLAITLLFAFPIFWQDIKERRFFSKKGTANTLCVILPFLAVGLGLMYYNYIRFGNPLDFGATYNLTGFDMTHRGFISDRFWLGIFEYFFQPFMILPKFPYFSVIAGHMHLISDYQGQIINEPLLGGFFSFNLIGLYLAALPSCRRQLHNKGLFAITVSSVLMGVIVAAVDIQMVGMTLRYLTDFSVFLMIGVILTILSIEESSKLNGTYSLHLHIIIALVFLCVIMNYITLIADGRYNNLRAENPTVFYALKYQLFSFLSIR